MFTATLPTEQSPIRKVENRRALLQNQPGAAKYRGKEGEIRDTMMRRESHRARLFAQYGQREEGFANEHALSLTKRNGIKPKITKELEIPNLTPRRIEGKPGKIRRRSKDLDVAPAAEAALGLKKGEGGEDRGSTNADTGSRKRSQGKKGEREDVHLGRFSLHGKGREKFLGCRKTLESFRFSRKSCENRKNSGQGGEAIVHGPRRLLVHKEGERDAVSTYRAYLRRKKLETPLAKS